jgi:hypothetical protein
VTATGPQHLPPQAPPQVGDQRQGAATADPPHRSGRPQQFAVEVWASPQLRNQDPGRDLSLAEALGRAAAPTDPEPGPEPELEP